MISDMNKSKSIIDFVYSLENLTPLKQIFGNDYLYKAVTFKKMLEYNITKKPHYFPSKIQIQTVNLCNASCIMCPLSTSKKKKPEVMSNELFEKIIKEIVQEQSPFTFVFLYLQNEPLIDKDIFKKIKLIKQLSNGKILTGLITNGSLFTPDKIKEFEESGLDQIRFSIDAFTEDMYNKIRKGLDFKTVLNNIDNILHSNCDTELCVGFVRQKDNILELKDFKKFWKKKNVSIDTIDILNRCGDLPSFQNLCLEKNIHYLERVFKSTLKKIARCCPSVLTSFNILNNGDVIICCNDYTGKLILGNVNNSSIKEIWNSDKFQKIRETLYKDYRNVPSCKNCTFWYNTPFK